MWSWELKVKILGHLGIMQPIWRGKNTQNTHTHVHMHRHVHTQHKQIAETHGRKQTTRRKSKKMGGTERACILNRWYGFQNDLFPKHSW